MYKFRYQGLSPEDKPIFSCIVPVEWLKRKLPTMGGCVNYAASSEKLNWIAENLYHFTDTDSKDNSTRIVSIQILRDGKESFKKPVMIHFQNVGSEFESYEWSIEILLLNHLFGFCALSASMGNVYLDFSDVLAVLKLSSEFDFKYGVGESPAAISSEILTCDAKSAFGVIFCNENKMRLAYIEEQVEIMSRSCKVDGLTVMTDIAVDQEQMLISVLYGR